ncbi:MAG: D-alanyl-D-alanine carboxypeptidase/D-alanyl-D-alanine-endopeptidase [Nannocystaceae bacterium]
MPPEVAAAAEFPATLEGQIDAALAQPFLAAGQIGVVAVDLESGKTLYRRGADVPLNPASNVKLVTTAAALGLLGPAHRYATRLYHGKDALQGAVIEGDLWLRGGGDPALVTEDLDRLAADLRARGIRRIGGGIVVDASHFDRDELPPGFDQKDELAAYRAPSGAASVNFNTFELRVRPGDTPDAPPFAAIEPPVPEVELEIEAKTAAGHLDRLAVGVEYDAKAKKTKVLLRGSIGVDAGSQSYRYPIAEPSRYAGEVLALALKHAGIKLGRSRVKLGKVPDDGVLTGVHHSEPLSVLIRAVNKHSNNFMAEQILKGLSAPGAPASFAGALVREREFLDELGVGHDGLRLTNGSGLYDTNRVSAAQLVGMLGAVHHDFRVASDFSRRWRSWASTAPRARGSSRATAAASSAPRPARSTACTACRATPARPAARRSPSRSSSTACARPMPVRPGNAQPHRRAARAARRGCQPLVVESPAGPSDGSESSGDG